jgi:SAM-dependent methyltransferase
MTSRAKRLSADDLAEAFHLAHAVGTLHDLGVLANLARPVAARQLARKLRLDPTMLGGMLDYVAVRTDLVSKSKVHFSATAEYSGASRFLLDLYLGAFGDTARQLAELARDPAGAARTVDRKRHAQAFENSGAAALGPVPRLIEQLGLNHLLDIGCGSASLLVELATRNPDFFGWGIEANPSMRRIARRTILAANAGKRVRLVHDDGSLAATTLRVLRPQVQAVTSCQVVNEMFAGGSGRAVAWLRRLRRAFPGRPLVVSDYYGRLGRPSGPADRMTLLHDFVQLTSGQGVPPSSRQEWQKIYAEAGCRLVHVVEADGVSWFIHIVAL